MALTPNQMPRPANGDAIPSTLARPGAAPSGWRCCSQGIGTGVAAAALTRLLELVQQFMWNGSGTNLWMPPNTPVRGGTFSCCSALGLVTGAGR
jgi:hypothetical protein